MSRWKPSDIIAGIFNLFFNNLFIIFIVSGFWHGANWTFIVWGALNAVYFLPLLLTKNNRNNLETVAQGKFFPSIKELSFMLLTFGLTVLTWIFFRAENIAHASQYIEDLVVGLASKNAYIETINLVYWQIGFAIPVLLFVFILIEWLGREGQYAIARLGINWPKSIRYAMYYAIIIAIFWFSGKEQQFIYFQF